MKLLAIFASFAFSALSALSTAQTPLPPAPVAIRALPEVESAISSEKEAEMIFVPNSDTMWGSLRGGLTADLGRGIKLGTLIGVAVPFRGADIKSSFLSLDAFVRGAIPCSPFEIQCGPTILYSPRRKIGSLGLRSELRLNLSEFISAHIGIITDMKPSKIHAVPVGISLRF